EPHHHEEVAARGVEVEIVAIVEVAIARADEADRLGDLVERVVVHRGEHAPSLSPSTHGAEASGGRRRNFPRARRVALTGGRWSHIRRRGVRLEVEAGAWQQTACRS